jgi:glycosyltransferase involved in cell wall biosynthesis
MLTSKDVTAVISTKGRYDTTLPLCLTSLALQTTPPGKLIIFDDNEQPLNLLQETSYQEICQLLRIAIPNWEVIYGAKKGQVWNHQKALEIAPTDYIWRLDDDNVAGATVLQLFIDTWNNYDKIGAIGGLVLDPKSILSLTKLASSKIDDIYLGINTQWFIPFDARVYPVDHLYSTFLFNRKAASNYCTNLSPAGHREETMFTHNILRNGYPLLVQPKAVTWHLRQARGGIRSFSQREFWQHDEEIFKDYLRKLGVQTRELKLIVLDCGLGDHIVFREILPEIKAAFPTHRLVIAACYPEVFVDDNVELISIAEAKWFLGKKIEDYSIYKFGYARNWSLPLVEAFRKLYLPS